MEPSPAAVDITAESNQPPKPDSDSPIMKSVIDNGLNGSSADQIPRDIGRNQFDKADRTYNSSFYSQKG